jgi:hypothetical protein
MDTNFLTIKRHPLEPRDIIRHMQALKLRGYSKEERLDIHNRVMNWIEKDLEPHPVLGYIVPMKRDYDRAIVEILSSSLDFIKRRPGEEAEDIERDPLLDNAALEDQPKEDITLRRHPF